MFQASLNHLSLKNHNQFPGSAGKAKICSISRNLGAGDIYTKPGYLLSRVQRFHYLTATLSGQQDCCWGMLKGKGAPCLILTIGGERSCREGYIVKSLQK